MGTPRELLNRAQAAKAEVARLREQLETEQAVRKEFGANYEKRGNMIYALDAHINRLRGVLEKARRSMIVSVTGVNDGQTIHDVRGWIEEADYALAQSPEQSLAEHDAKVRDAALEEEINAANQPFDNPVLTKPGRAYDKGYLKGREDAVKAIRALKGEG